MLVLQGILKGFLIYLGFSICSGNNFEITLNSNIKKNSKDMFGVYMT